jgi:pseudouridine synthase
MRLNRFMARAGVASRRKSDILIRRGAVRVNGEIVAAPGCLVGGEDRVEVDGRLVRLPEDSQYLLLNKESGTLVTHRDRGGRPTVFGGLEEVRAATVAVGRLDRDTTGVLLLTDDGELAHRLMHPRYEVEKLYCALVVGVPSAAALQRLRAGVLLEDGMTAPARVRIVSRPSAERPFCELELCVHEGRKHQIKRMCAAVGHRVRSLHREAFAGFTAGNLQPGECRRLREGEIRCLKSLVGLPVSEELQPWPPGD